MPIGFPLSDEMRRLITEARERALGSPGGGGDDPYSNIPSQQAPRQVPYWQPGTLYQPGDLVQPNIYGDVDQTTLTNSDFESGDSGWTYGSRFSIENVAGFDGSWRANFSSHASLLVGVSFNGSVYAPVYSTDGDTWSVATDTTTGGLLLACNGSTFIAVGNAVTYTSSDGDNWNSESTGIPTSGVAFLVYLPAAGLFARARASTQDVYTSPDGVTWTLRSGVLPAVPASSSELVASDGSVDVVVTTSGQFFYTSDGISWSAAASPPSWTSATGLTYDPTSGKFFATGQTGGTQELYSSSDGDTWAEVSSNNLDATLGVGVQLACNPSTGLLCGLVASVGSAATTDKVATSSDGGVNWSTVNSFAGDNLRWSTTLEGFVLFPSASSTDTNEMAYSSSDGSSWTKAEYHPTNDRVPFLSADKVELTDTQTCINDDRATTLPGQIVTARAKVQTSASGVAKIGIAWYNSGGSLIRIDYGNSLTGASTNWREVEVSALAPIDTATCSVALAGSGSGQVLFDTVEWNHFTQADHPCLIYEATQADAGHSDEVEPTWPTIVGNTVVDNEVTWTARAGNCVEWEAKPILLSGASEPTWPEEEGSTVVDNTILWTADSGRVKDVNCPNKKAVVIAASKIFCFDDDIIAFSATVNPLDWSSADDAGFIPFGLNTYGSEPGTALGIYRSNLVAWNSKAFQMWQVDEDPQNFALLDAIPIGNRFYKSGSPVNNDLVWLTDEGVRNMGIAGASTNLQAGHFGKQIDPLIQAAIDAIGDEDDILSIDFPGQGQYWLVFEETAYVLTINGGKNDMSWSRYVFPSAIDDYTIKDGDLYLRSGDKVWLYDKDAVQDDVGGTPTNFEGRVWWHYLDFGALGVTKSLIGFDVVATGTFNVAIGYDQSNTATATTDYELTGDTLPNGVIPLPVTAPSFQFRLTWAGGEAWEWYASALYLQDWRTTS